MYKRKIIVNTKKTNKKQINKKDKDENSERKLIKLKKKNFAKNCYCFAMFREIFTILQLKLKKRYIFDT